MPRRLCEPLCIAFGTSVSSPTAPTYQLYDLPHKLKPRLYMEAREPWRVVREMKGWEQAATAEARSFLHDLLADRSAHDTFYVQLPVPGASNRCRLLQAVLSSLIHGQQHVLANVKRRAQGSSSLTIVLAESGWRWRKCSWDRCATEWTCRWPAAGASGGAQSR